MGSRSTWFAMAALVGIGLVACGGATRAPATPAISLATLSTALSIPIGPDGERALEQLTERAATDVEAAWIRLRFLIDLFDDARYRRSDDSLRVLAKELAVPANRGAAATDQFLDALLVEVDRLLTQERLHAGANDARRLLAGDRHSNDPASFASFSRELAELVERKSAVAVNAVLRQAARCEKAARDAVGVGPRRGQARLDYCLWSLYADDPAGYGGADGQPTPPWSLLETALIDRYRAAMALSPRLSPAASARLKALTLWLDEHRRSLPRAPDIDSAPRVRFAAVYRSAPLMSSAKSPAELTAIVTGDGRASAAHVARADAQARDLLDVARAAAKAGAARLELVVATPAPVAQSRFWKQHAAHAPAQRASMLPLSLALLGSSPITNPSASLPRGQRLRADDPSLGLAIEVDRERWRLFGRDGELVAMPAGSAERLAEELDRVLDAFPDERSAALVPRLGATVQDVADVASLAMYRANGSLRLPHVALAGDVAMSERGLRDRVRRRAAATVVVSPQALAPRRDIIRRCYQQQLDGNPKLGASFEIERQGQSLAIANGPKRGPLWACVVPALSDFMVENDIGRATVALSPTAPAD